MHPEFGMEWGWPVTGKTRKLCSGARILTAEEFGALLNLASDRTGIDLLPDSPDRLVFTQGLSAVPKPLIVNST